MRKEHFEAEIDRVWREHRAEVRGIFEHSQARSGAVQERLLALQHSISRASGERINFKWGPAEYDLDNHAVRVPYSLSFDREDQGIEFHIRYRLDGTELFGRSVDDDGVDRVLVILTEAVWEAFQPPGRWTQPIYAPPVQTE